MTSALNQNGLFLAVNPYLNDHLTRAFLQHISFEIWPEYFFFKTPLRHYVFNKFKSWGHSLKHIVFQILAS